MLGFIYKYKIYNIFFIIFKEREVETTTTTILLFRMLNSYSFSRVITLIFFIVYAFLCLDLP